MKIGEILEAIKTETENIATLAKRIEGISEKPLRDALKNAGYEPGNKGWIFTGEGEEPLEKSIFDYRTKKPRATSKTTSERKKQTTNEEKVESANSEINIPTNERNHDKIKEQKQKTTKVRKRASFDIEAELLKELKIFAITEEKNVYEIVENAIRSYLQKSK